MSHVFGVNDGVGYGVAGRNDIAYGVGVHGVSSPYGIGAGVLGRSYNIGVSGISFNLYSHRAPGVYGIGRHVGVRGESDLDFGWGVRGDGWYGVYGSSARGDGVFGGSGDGPGVHGLSLRAPSVLGESLEGVGMHGNSISGPGVWGLSNSGYGIVGYSIRSIGMYGWGYPGVYGESDFGPGLRGRSSSGYGVYGSSNSGLAALLDGNVRVNGNLRIVGNVNVTGNINKAAVQFKIDHPLDPANKYLYHSSVESPDMKNMYDGVVTLDQNGEAEIELPDWFGALNKDFRYQLTAIGAPGPISISQRKYLMLIQTIEVAAITALASKLQAVLLE
jgi:hypothetical protein